MMSADGRSSDPIALVVFLNAHEDFPPDAFREERDRELLPTRSSLQSKACIERIDVGILSNPRA